MSTNKTGELIKSLRKVSGLSTTELGKAVKCSPESIRRIETGNQDPSLSLLTRILNAVDAPDRARLLLLGGE